MTDDRLEEYRLAKDSTGRLSACRTCDGSGLVNGGDSCNSWEEPCPECAPTHPAYSADAAD